MIRLGAGVEIHKTHPQAVDSEIKSPFVFVYGLALAGIFLGIAAGDTNAKPASADCLVERAPCRLAQVHNTKYRNIHHRKATMDHGLTEPPITTHDEQTELSTFPITREDFEADSRVSWSRITAKWTLEADDGSEFEFDQVLKRWIPVVCCYTRPDSCPV